MPTNYGPANPYVLRDIVRCSYCGVIHVEGMHTCGCSKQTNAINQLPTDIVNHPPHYKGLNGLETIDVIEAFATNPHRAMAIKYILRAGKKGSAEIDLKKALWWIQREISQYVPF